MTVTLRNGQTLENRILEIRAAYASATTRTGPRDRRSVDGFDRRAGGPGVYATEREAYAAMFLEAGLPLDEAAAAADDLIRDLDARQAAEARAKAQPLNRYPSNLAFLPFVDPFGQRLDPTQLSQAMQGFGYPPDVADTIAGWFSQNVSPQQFYQPLWNALGGRGPADLEQLGFNFAPPNVRADLAEAMAAQRAAGHAMNRPDLAFRRRGRGTRLPTARTNNPVVDPTRARPANTGVVDPTTIRPGNTGVVDPTAGRPGNTGTIDPTTVRPGNTGVVDPTTVRPGNTGTIDPTTVRPGNTGTIDPTAVRLGNTGTIDPTTVRPGNTGVVDPTTGRPGNTGTIDPTTVRPGNTGIVDPTTVWPGNTGTIDPTTGRPANTGTIDPTTVRPGNTGTIDPTTGRPGNTGTIDPTTSRPANTGTIDPTTGRPANTGTIDPTTGRPANTGTIDPTTGRPANTGTIDPTTGRPGNTGTIDPTTGRPGNTGTIDPTTGRPANTGTIDPTTGRPANTGTIDPTTGRPANTGTIDPTTGRPANTGTIDPTTGRPANTGTTDPTTNRPGNTPTIQPPTPVPTGTPLALTSSQARIASALYAPGAKVIDQPGEGQGRVSEGDRVEYTVNGERKVKTLTRREALDFNQRSNVVRVALETPKLPFQTNPTPQIKDANGNLVQENDFWEYRDAVGANGKRIKLMQIKPGVKPADAIRHVFDNPNQYAFDCAAAVRMVNMRATLDTIGEDDFNDGHKKMIVYGRHDGVDGQWDGGNWKTEVFADEVNRTGDTAEFGRYDPSNGDDLVPGDWRWYERRGNMHNASQGWNTIYLGRDEQGRHQFWRSGGTFNDRSPGDLGTGIKGEYLAGLRGTTDVEQLIQHDRRPGAAR